MSYQNYFVHAGTQLYSPFTGASAPSTLVSKPAAVQPAPPTPANSHYAAAAATPTAAYNPAAPLMGYYPPTGYYAPVPTQPHHPAGSTTTAGYTTVAAGYYTMAPPAHPPQYPPLPPYPAPLPPYPAPQPPNAKPAQPPQPPTTPYSRPPPAKKHAKPPSAPTASSSIPLVSSDYGYGYNYGHEHGAFPHTHSFPSATAVNYMQVMGQSSAARNAGARGVRFSKQSKVGETRPSTVTNLLQLAGYSGTPSFLSASGYSSVYCHNADVNGPVISSRGRGFPLGRAMGGMRGRGGGGVGKPHVDREAVQRECLSKLGKYVMPRSASLTLIDLAGFQCTFSYADANDDDYEAFHEERGYYPSMLHKCEVKVCGKPYVACAEVKRVAKERCAEKAIPDIMNEKLKEQKARRKQSECSFDQLEDEVPWTSLCSLALFKLYEDWTEEGVEIPDKLYNFQGVGKIIHDNQELAEKKSSTSSSLGVGGGGISKDNLQFKYVDLQKPGSSQQSNFPTATPAQVAKWQSTAQETLPAKHWPGSFRQAAPGNNFSQAPPTNSSYRQATQANANNFNQATPANISSRQVTPGNNFNQTTPSNSISSQATQANSFSQAHPVNAAPSWQQSSQIPSFTSTGPAPSSQPPPAQHPPPKLLEYRSGKVVDPLSKNPLQLLHELVPSASFDVNTFGTRRQFFVTQVEVQGVKYTGEAFSKKDSKSICAIKALQGAFGISYPAFKVEDSPCV